MQSFTKTHKKYKKKKEDTPHPPSHVGLRPKITHTAEEEYRHSMFTSSHCIIGGGARLLQQGERTRL